ncbi:MAG: rRNA maturation RNase YbeY [bacterium]
MDILIQNAENTLLSKKDIEKAVEKTIVHEGMSAEKPWGISVTFVSPEQIQELNREYRKKDYPTDVISFSFREGEGSEFAGFLLGDIVICPQIVFENAKTYGVTEKSELFYVLIHGTLHLTGNDHKNEDDTVIMRSKEQNIMKEMGFETLRFEKN